MSDSLGVSGEAEVLTEFIEFRFNKGPSARVSVNTSFAIKHTFSGYQVRKAGELKIGDVVSEDVPPNSGGYVPPDNTYRVINSIRPVSKKVSEFWMARGNDQYTFDMHRTTQILRTFATPQLLRGCCMSANSSGPDLARTLVIKSMRKHTGAAFRIDLNDGTCLTVGQDPRILGQDRASYSRLGWSVPLQFAVNSFVSEVKLNTDPQPVRLVSDVLHGVADLYTFEIDFDDEDMKQIKHVSRGIAVNRCLMLENYP